MAHIVIDKARRAGRQADASLGVRLKVVLPAAMIAFMLPGLMEASPLSLSDACRRAQEFDAQVKSSEADLKISKEEVSKAASSFLPNIRASASRGRNRTESITPFTPSGNTLFYNTQSNSVSLRQSLFNMEEIASLKQAKAVRAKSESLLMNEKTRLIVRTAEAFFNVLYAQQNLEFIRAQVAATGEQLKQAQSRHHNGLGTITEISEAQASFDMAVADEASGVASLDFNRRELERITGVYTEELCRFLPERMSLLVIEPHDVNEWIVMAEKNSPKLGAAQQDIQIATREVEKSRALRYPTVDLVAGRSYSVSENNYTIGSTYDTWSVNLQVSVPIYTGGYTSANIRQAVAKRMKSNEELIWQQRAMVSDVRKFYNGVLNGMVQIKAYEQAVKSHEVALEGTRKGFQAGFRSNVDVLNAQQKLLESRRNLAKARYQYILDRLMLKEVAGVLTVADIEQMEAWFSPEKG